MANAKKKTRKRRSKPSTKKAQSTLFRVCLCVCLVFLCMIALAKLGIVGRFIYQFSVWWIGSSAMALWILLMLFSILALVKKDILQMPKRYLFAILFLFMAWMLFQAIESTRPQPVWEAFMSVISHSLLILSNQVTTSYGLIGGLLLGIFGMLFDYSGSFLLVVVFVILAVLLSSYSWLVTKISQRQVKPKQEKPKKVKTAPIKKEKAVRFIEADEEPEEVAGPIIVYDEPKEEIHQEERQEEPLPKTYLETVEDGYSDYHLPKLSLLEEVTRKSRSNANVQAARTQGQKLIEILQEFGVNAQLVQTHIGPTVTKFEIKPELGVRVSKISNLQYDIKMALAAKDIRIEAPIPGKSAVGIEVPNVEKTMVHMKELMRAIPSSLQDKKTLFALGKDLMGNSVYGELSKMPHLLIAGATGSGKSVCVNAIISSLLLRSRPDEVKLILIDPKKVEFTPYNDIPHLIAPVITDGDLANKALKVVVEMMDARYDLFGTIGVRNIDGFNAYVANHPDDSFNPMPRLVVIIDELADLMLVAAKDVEASIQRITQLARAAGIHLVVATQRPSVDVITGVIKANIPSRIAFAVSQAVDSRTILDQAGAERLLGNGDMLYLPNGQTSPTRIQGVFITDDEVTRITSFVKSQAKPRYDDAFITLKDLANMGKEVASECSDPLYVEVKQFVIQSRKASTSLIQRKFSIGYSRAARLIDALEQQGIVGPARGSKPREILVENTLESLED